MFRSKRLILTAALSAMGALSSLGTGYYIDSNGGNDGNSGTSPGSAWASLSHASSLSYSPGDQILLQRGDTFNGKLKLSGSSGTVLSPIVVASYGTGNDPIIDAAGYLAGIHIENSAYIEVRDLEITADGGAPVDGSNAASRYGVLIKPISSFAANGITLSNLYIHTIYPYQASTNEGVNPTTYLGYGIDVKGQSSNPSDGIVIEGCRVEDTGHKFLGLNWANHVQVLNNMMKNIGGPAMVPNRCDDLLVQGNVVDHSGAYTDPRMHGRGSGIWPIRCNRVLIENNAFMHARGRYDSCGAHIDIGNTDVVIQKNLSLDNEGGFVEILGVNSNCTYRYNISINDGARLKNGPGTGDGYVLLFSGHNFSGQNRAGPYNSYIYNNTIYVKGDQLCAFSIEETTLGVLVANNLFYIDGPAQDSSPTWLNNYPVGMPDTVVWTNNVYQRGQIFPSTWPFTEGSALYANPDLANPGGLTAEDYIPAAGSFIEERGIVVPQLPGDAIGVRIGLAVSNDFFGNPIVGLPDIGAVEIGGTLSTVPGAAFLDRPAPESSTSAVMTAISGPVGSEYYFSETSGNSGGTDSGWQSSPVYSDGGLLPGTGYDYTVLLRHAPGSAVGTGVVSQVQVETSAPFPHHILLNEDFSVTPNPANAAAPFPVNTWYCDSAATWSAEDQASSVSVQSDGAMRIGWGYDEVMLQYYTDQTWDLTRDYEFSGDWQLVTVLSNHLGLIVGVGEYDPATGALLQRIKETTVGELVSPVAGQTNAFALSVSAAELQAAGVNATNRVGLFLHHDDDGVLQSVTAFVKSDVYEVDNLLLRFFGTDLDTDLDGIPDGVELAAGLDPANPADGALDADGDGVINSAEYRLGTGINDPLDVVQVVPSATAADFELTIPGINVLSNRLYILEQKASLLGTEPWRAVDAASGSANAGMGDYLFQYPSAEPASFLRIRVEWE